MKLGCAIKEKLFFEIPRYRQLVAENFHQIYPTSCLKPKYLDLDMADQLYNWALENGLEFRGHVLAWHRGIDSLSGFNLEDFIFNTVSRYPMATSWDVVGEALTENCGWRNSELYQHYGDRLLFKLFSIAAEANPDSTLFYTDFWRKIPQSKWSFVKPYLLEISDAGIKTGLAIQMHLTQFPLFSLFPLYRKIQEYVQTGIVVDLPECQFLTQQPGKSLPSQIGKLWARNTFYKELAFRSGKNGANLMGFWNAFDVLARSDIFGGGAYIADTPGVFDSNWEPLRCWVQIQQSTGMGYQGLNTSKNHTKVPNLD